MAEDNNPERVWDLIEKIRFCMLATNDGKDIRSRPMTAHAERGENAVYFLLDLKDHKNPEAFGNSCMAFADTGDMDYVSVSGVGAVSVSTRSVSVRFFLSTRKEIPCSKAWH